MVSIHSAGPLPTHQVDDTMEAALNTAAAMNYP